MKTSSSNYRGQQPFATDTERVGTSLVRIPENVPSTRARFNNQPAPIGTLPAQPPVSRVVVVAPDDAAEDATEKAKPDAATPTN